MGHPEGIRGVGSWSLSTQGCDVQPVTRQHRLIGVPPGILMSRLPAGGRTDGAELGATDMFLTLGQPVVAVLSSPSTCRTLIRSAGSENGFSRSSTPGSSLPCAPRTG
jgi:hypothetical protein